MDIDPQAVEVTKFSLLLKLLEEENQETSGELFKHSQLKLLPDLKNNIKCGNSLIGSDFYDNQNLNLFDKEEMRKINTMDWDRAFPDIFQNGGFDVVIGNPPYIRIQNLNEFAPEQVNYFNTKYSNIISDSYDIYVLFINKGFSLSKENGVLGFILPHKFFQAQMGEKNRTMIFQNNCLSKIVDFTTNQIFENATTYTCLLFLSKKLNKKFLYKRFSTK